MQWAELQGGSVQLQTRVGIAVAIPSVINHRGLPDILDSTIARFKAAIKVDTPFIVFWGAQNSLYAMYGLDELSFIEATDIWKRTYETRSWP